MAATSVQEDHQISKTQYQFSDVNKRASVQSERNDFQIDRKRRD